MRVLTTLATFFCGMQVWVDADFYLGFGVPTVPRQSSSGRPPAIVKHLYECKGEPAGTPVFRAARSICTLITSRGEIVNIYASCNFYTVLRPDLQGHEIELSDGSFLPRTVWEVGYFNHAMDHPNLAGPTSLDIGYYKENLGEMARENIFPAYLVNGLAFYFAQKNLIAFSGNPVLANSMFLGVTIFLRRSMETHRSIDQEKELTRMTRVKNKLEDLFKVALGKMIDPCAVLRGNLQTYASTYCATFCDFHSVVARHYGTTANRCSSLQGGHCVGVVCTCLMASSSSHPFAGCQSIPMQQCNNAMRATLKQGNLC